MQDIDLRTLWYSNQSKTFLSKLLMLEFSIASYLVFNRYKFT
jgi:hypothetical protein